MSQEGLSRHTKIALRVSATALALGVVGAWAVVPRLVESAYAGNSWPLFNDLITGQSQHPLQHYLEIVKRLLVPPSISALVLSLLALGLSTERGRQAGEGIVMNPLLLALLALTWTAVRATASLDLPHFGDEDEKIVAAWLIAEGEHLYRSIFAHHGPLNYMVAHLVYALTLSKELLPYRIAQWTIIGLGSMAVAASPLLPGWRERLWAGSTFLLLAATLYPLWLGNHLLYHVQAGVLFTAVVSLLLLPIALRIRVPPVAAALAGAAMVALVAAAYSFALPIALMLVSAACFLLANKPSGCAEKVIIPFVVGGLCWLVVVGVWLLAHGDILGYFVFHIHFNQEVYASFLHFEPLLALRQLKRLAQPRFGWASAAALAFALWLFSSLRHQTEAKPGRGVASLRFFGVLTLLAAILYLNPRDSEDFRMAAMQVASVGLLSLFALRPINTGRSQYASLPRAAAHQLLLVLLVIITQFTSLIGPISSASVGSWGRARVQEKESASMIELIQDTVSPSERIQALAFNPRWYLWTDRRPASGHYYYLPWQAAYSKRPILGFNIDICADMKRVEPKIVVWDRWMVWGKYALEDYEPCLYELLTTQYEPLEGMPHVFREIQHSIDPDRELRARQALRQSRH